MTKNLSLLGSTGSIGTQSLDVARKRGYRVRALSAFSNVKKIEEQIREFKPDVAALVSEDFPLCTAQYAQVRHRRDGPHNES